jgi:hypothetical protein
MKRLIPNSLTEFGLSLLIFLAVLAAAFIFG